MKTTIALTLLALTAALLPGHWLELQRGSVEPWQLLTCHFTHWNHEQLAWDSLSFMALGMASSWRNQKAFRATLLASAVVVPIAVLIAAPAVQSYRGLSGIASGFFALLLTLEVRRNRLVALCGIVFAAKLIFEAATGATLFVRNLGPGVVAVPAAHLAGAMAGCLIGLWFVVRPHPEHSALKTIESFERSPCSSHC